MLNWLKNLKVVQRLAILIGILSIAILIVGSMGYVFLNRLSGDLETMYEDKLTAVRLINDSRVHARKVEANIYALMLTTDPKENQELMDDINKRGKKI